MSRYCISSDDLIILRDGRPFGAAGIFGGNSLDWPYPQTLAGMCRSAIGLNCCSDYFSHKSNLEQILKVSLDRVLPLLCSDHDEFLLPIPADIIFCGEKQRQAHVLSYKSMGKGEGTDVKCPHWLYPTIATEEKAATRPKFMRQQFANDYLTGSLGISKEIHDEDADFVSGPILETRIHTAIDPKTGSADEGKLFAESGLYLKAPKHGHSFDRFEILLPFGENEQGILGDIKISFDLSGLTEDMEMPEFAYLGGERRRVLVEKDCPPQFPEPIKTDGTDRFLKLLLTTHGDFGSWAPQWLVPDGDESRCDWVTEPRSGVKLRLRSAVLSGWAPVSGWDYAKYCQKAFKKLVCPGSVYLVELQDSTQSGKFIDAIWGKSICEAESQSDKDGYGQVLVAKGMHISEVKE
ncbi:type III-B CRISPR module-associated Cmr3 family protein [Maridesulfovibrio bastinii]|uniref:type III-B CRISPR module-associated Cmr3 family protein n=1 Tax=Maridesulfovibrio bastinii TaxID=47157 RepID=UPI000427DCAA|nr:type III-B CRISPR module-associated Cmr3 family protein [Maridesulfovibrio bastinii]